MSLHLTIRFLKQWIQKYLEFPQELHGRSSKRLRPGATENYVSKERDFTEFLQSRRGHWNSDKEETSIS